MNSCEQSIGDAGRTFIKKFAAATGQDVTGLINAVARYNCDFSAYGSEVYSQLGTRVAHWANWLDQGWFERRLDFPLSIASHHDLIIDLGFSVPYAFSFPYLRKGNSKFLFIDSEPSTLEFYNILLKMEKWKSVSGRSQVLLADLEKQEELSGIDRLISERAPKSILIIASEILEHLHNPEPVLQWMQGMLQRHSRALVYCTLPIGPKIPSHAVEFVSAGDADEWIDRYFPNHQAFVLSPGVVQDSRQISSYSIYCAWADSRAHRSQANAD